MTTLEFAQGVPETHPEEKGLLTWGSGKNWVGERGGLPSYINSVALALVRQGDDRQDAIATAVNVCRRTCATGKWGGNPKMPVSGAIKVAACKAIAEWDAKRAGADMSEPTCTRCNLRCVLDLAADPKKPYGDVAYADPGYQSDGVSRYPLDTVKHIRAAASYISQSDNQKPYTAAQLKAIIGRIRSAAQKAGIDTQLSRVGNRVVIDLGVAVVTTRDQQPVSTNSLTTGHLKQLAQVNARLTKAGMPASKRKQQLRILAQQLKAGKRVSLSVPLVVATR